MKNTMKLSEINLTVILIKLQIYQPSYSLTLYGLDKLQRLNIDEIFIS